MHCSVLYPGMGDRARLSSGVGGGGGGGGGGGREKKGDKAWWGEGRWGGGMVEAAEVV